MTLINSYLLIKGPHLQKATQSKVISQQANPKFLNDNYSYCVVNWILAHSEMTFSNVACSILS